jgi:RNA polymerase sigma-70 factor (ECF subfamily)
VTGDVNRTAAKEAAREDALLVERFVRCGDEALFAELVARYKDRVYRLALSILGSIEFAPDAQDVAQDVFLEVYRHLRSFRADSSFSTWLYRVTTNRALDVKGRRRFSAPHLPEQAIHAIGADVRSGDDALSAAQVRSAMSHLPEIQQAILNLYYWMGYSTQEIAEQLSLGQNTVKSHLFRARRTLHETLVRRGVCG